MLGQLKSGDVEILGRIRMSWVTGSLISIVILIMLMTIMNANTTCPTLPGSMVMVESMKLQGHSGSSDPVAVLHCNALLQRQMHGIIVFIYNVFLDCPMVSSAVGLGNNRSGIGRP